MKIFLISPVRNADSAVQEQLASYVKTLEDSGCRVHWPMRDTEQNDPSGGYQICRTNFQAILDSDEIHIWYDETSGGSKFDMGGVFMLVEMLGYWKKVVIPNSDAVVDTALKSFFKVFTRVAHNTA